MNFFVDGCVLARNDKVVKTSERQKPLPSLVKQKPLSNQFK